MNERIGYVVIEFNQASGQPSLSPFAFLSEDLEEAQERADLLYAETRKVGRKERFAVGTVLIEDD